MDELSIEHSELDFQEEMKDALSEAESQSKRSKSKRQKKKNTANGINKESASVKTVPDVAIITDVNLVDSFQPVKNADSQSIAVKRNGKCDSSLYF